MWEINGYIAPAARYLGLSPDDILSFGDLVDTFRETDDVFVPDAFYEYPDREEITACEYL